MFHVEIAIISAPMYIIKIDLKGDQFFLLLYNKITSRGSERNRRKQKMRKSKFTKT